MTEARWAAADAAKKMRISSPWSNALAAAVEGCVTILWAGDEPVMRNEAMGEDWIRLAHALKAYRTARQS